ncbi:coagulation factor II (thrombin) receptor-like 1, tandem duplicate 2 [Sardina pilchardus]|uniref:coagulation factor II (thrombin) receptor-like 1, tandem duplicate 2 n=1 Tax=Sardina pilchardus TaxID=27697 RepID=UPI002E0EBE96
MAALSLAKLLIFLWCAFNTASQTVAQKGRGFIGTEVENTDRVKVDQATTQILKSSLTTVFLPIIYIVVFSVGLPANLMALWVFLFRTKKKHPASIYMANLALSDLLFVIWIPLKIAYHFNGNNWIYGEGLCKVLIGFFYGNMYCSILFIACLSVQRYWVVAHPFSQVKKNNRVAILISLFIWFFIWTSTTPLYLYQQTVKLNDPEITTCHDVSSINPNKVFESIQYSYYYFMTMAVVVFLLPTVVIIVAYFMLLRAVGNSMTEGNAGKNRRKAVVLIITVLAVFLVSFIPSNIMLVVHYSLLSNGIENNAYGFYITTLCMASFNSCLDPFIYYYVSEDFRAHVKNMLLCRSNRTVERMRVSFSSMKYSTKTKTYMSDNSNTQTSSC